MSRYRNTTLEMLKLLASYMVVFIHVSFKGTAGIAVDAVARFAVPFFFVVSGFYSYHISLDKIRKRAKHIFFLLVIATVCHTLCKTALMLLTHDYNGISVYFREYLRPEALARLLLLNMPVHLDYLWYLLAMLYVYYIFYMITKYRLSERRMLSIAVPILAFTVIVGEVLSLFDISLPIAPVRNYVFLGYPCFALGLLVKKYQHKFRSVPNAVILAAVALGILESLLSRFLFGRKEIYIGSVLVLLAFMCISIKYSHIRYPKICNALAGCSTYIYIFHIVVSSVMQAGYSMLSINTSSALIQAVHPFLACIAVTIVAFIMIKTVHRFIFSK